MLKILHDFHHLNEYLFYQIFFGISDYNLLDLVWFFFIEGKVNLNILIQIKTNH